MVYKAVFLALLLTATMVPLTPAALVPGEELLEIPAGIKPNPLRHIPAAIRTEGKRRKAKREDVATTDDEVVHILPASDPPATEEVFQDVSEQPVENMEPVPEGGA